MRCQAEAPGHQSRPPQTAVVKMPHSSPPVAQPELQASDGGDVSRDRVVCPLSCLVLLSLFFNGKSLNMAVVFCFKFSFVKREGD